MKVFNFLVVFVLDIWRLQEKSCHATTVYYMSDLCGGLARDIGYSAIMYFHRGATPTSSVYPYETEFNCVVTLQGIEAGQGVYFRDFLVRDPLSTPGDCSQASFTVYLGPDISAPTSFRDCGTSFTPRAIETTTQSLTFVLSANYSNNILNPGINDTVDNATLPQVYFAIEITDFIPDCNTTVYREPTWLKCNDSRRCLRRDIVACDAQNIANCRSPSQLGDTSDEAYDLPGDCTTTSPSTTTTTTIASTTPAPDPPDLTPLYATMGSILGLLSFMFCAWRPGYLPWRLSRMRNWPCFRSRYSRCSSACYKACKCCHQHASYKAKNQLNVDNGDFLHDSDFKPEEGGIPGGGAAWMIFAAGDGGHLSENR